MRPRVPLAYAGLLIVALIAAIGFAAFSPTTQSGVVESDAAQGEAPASSEAMSARVASAILALRVADAENRTASTQTTEQTSTTLQTEQDDAQAFGVEESSKLLDIDPPADEVASTTAATADPSIRVTSPSDGDTVSNKTTTFKGTTDVGSTVRSGPYKATMSADGSWSIKLVLATGANAASFTTTNASGATASTRITVTYKPASAATTTTHIDTTTTHAHAAGTHEDHEDTTTTHAHTTQTQATNTTTGSSGSNWSPNWPADSGGQRNVENWRSTVAKYWPASRVDCVLGIILRESRGNARAYNSSSNAEGLMQHLSKYWVSRARGAGFVDSAGRVATPYNGAANIAAGAYLANYFDSAVGQWWNPWKSPGGGFTANYGTCQSSDPS